MLISAVILSYDSERHLEPCLESLLEALQGLPERSEVLVVENGSRDRSADILRRYQGLHPDTVKGLFQDRNLGTTASRNLALRQAAGRYVLILDSDVVVPAGALERLLGYLETHERCGLVAPRLVYPDGRSQLSEDRFPTLWWKLARLVSLKALERQLPERGADLHPREVDYAVSAFWLLRRELLAEVGLLDERFFYAPEDVDYCLSIWLGGYTVVYEPRVEAVHDAQELSRGRHVNRFTLHHAIGLLRYFLKHRYLNSRAGLYRRIEKAQAKRWATSSSASTLET
ncbi:MAG: glycosyltransferase family 2 protein [Kiloniellales bacterium]